MEESNEELRVIPELYFLIAKFLSGGPLKETAKTLLKELESVEVLPRRLDWEGREHAQSFRELDSQHNDVSWRRLAAVCEQALRLARSAPSTADPSQLRLSARLSLLSETLVRPKPKYASFKQDHSVVRRVLYRELGSGGASVVGGRGGESIFPRRLLGGMRLQRRTLGHLSAVYCLVFERSGRFVVTGADDLLVKVWSARDGRPVATLRGAGAEITDVCASQDSALLAAGSVERLVRVWCLATGAPRAVLHAHGGTITSVHWAPPARADLRWLASTSTDGSVAFWTCSPDGQFLSQPVQYVERMRPGACHMICAAWSAGGAYLAAGSADHHVRVYAVEAEGGAEGGSPRRVLETAAHADAVDSVAWAHRGLRFVSGSKDGTAALWSLHATQWRHVTLRTEAAAEPGRRLKVTMVCWDRSDAFVMTAVSDNTVRVWCSRTYRQTRVLRGHSDEAYVLEAHPFLPAVLLSAGHDGQLFVWDAAAGEALAHFHNHIEGQGDGAIFDAKWGDGASVAASDSHGHLLLLGLGAGHRLLKELPTELFFHTDYRPLTRDAAGGALDEQTQMPPHLMPPPFLVDVEGAPHPPELQRLVPGREALTLQQLIPSPHAAEQARSRLDLIIDELLAANHAVEFGPAAPAGAAPAGPAGGGGVWRGEGVRHTAGSWQRGDPLDVPYGPRLMVPPLSRAVLDRIEQTCGELNAFELSWYRREMRRRPLMISTAPAGSGAPGRRRVGRKRGELGAHSSASAPAPAPASPPPLDSVSSSDSDSTVRLTPSPSPSHSGSRTPSPRRRRAPPSRSHSSRASSANSSSSSTTSGSSEYSDWEAGASLAPPARARRRPVAARRYSPGAPQSTKRGAQGAQSTQGELPEAYRVGEWLTAVAPRKAPYHPQMGDECLYFRLGHQRYLEAVAEKDLYRLTARDKPWEQTRVYDCELVQVVGIRYVIRPPRVACLKLACSLAPTPRRFTVRYHDMPDVIDFLVLRQQFDSASRRSWSAGERFRCMIDDAWWTGVVLEATGEPPGAVDEAEAGEWAAAAARLFLSVRVQWDNGEVERLSPWDLEPLDPARLPAERGGAVPVLPEELQAVLPRGDCEPRAANAIAGHIEQVMSLSVAEPFVAPVDLQAYPSYALVVPYPVDLATIKARFENLFYRRLAAAQFDVRCLAGNAERFNEPHSPIVRQARLVSDLLLHVIRHWRDADVLAAYHRLTAAYSTDEETPRRRWRDACWAVLRAVTASADAEPFGRPVSPSQAPDYRAVVRRPMDLGTVRARLQRGDYEKADEFAADVRLVFANSRLYNTNKRSRIYSMTVRLSALFEALWAREAASRARTAPRRAPRRPGRRPPRPASSSSSETLAATSRRVHAARRADSWDSDAPLHMHTKGKGVGKKSKSNGVASVNEPVAGTSAAAAHDSWGASGSVYVATNARTARHDNGTNRSARRLKRRRSSGASSVEANGVCKRTRERFDAETSSSCSSEGEEADEGGGRYESDRSYRPRCSSDEDAPLQQYRRRRASPGVSLRARTPRRYNEDSDDDSAAAISKRLHSQRHPQRRPQRQPPQPSRPQSDHDYVNGHAPVSISSRGRVRRLTAKARGLLRE